MRLRKKTKVSELQGQSTTGEARPLVASADGAEAPADGWPGGPKAARADTANWAQGAGRRQKVRKTTASKAEKELESEQMAFWWAKKEAEYEAGAIVMWDGDGGSSGSGAWVTRGGTARKRPSFAEGGWDGGVRGQLVHHSVDVRAAWWGDTVGGGGSGSERVADLGAGPAADAPSRADLAARARKARRK